MDNEMREINALLLKKNEIDRHCSREYEEIDDMEFLIENGRFSLHLRSTY